MGNTLLHPRLKSLSRGKQLKRAVRASAISVDTNFIIGLYSHGANKSSEMSMVYISQIFLFTRYSYLLIWKIVPTVPCALVHCVHEINKDEVAIVSLKEISYVILSNFVYVISLCGIFNRQLR
jgi:hypothetical protein